MISLVVISLIIFSGSLITYTYNSEKVLRVVPVTIMAVATILYLFGLIGRLSIGVFVLNILTGVVFVTCGYLIYKKGELRADLIELAKNYGVVLIFVLVVSYLNVGMQPHWTDDFSHWADVVKAMFYIDDLATNPDSQSLFRDYPPGMALIQFLFIEEKSLFRGINYFPEWRLFAAYHIVILSLVFPILEDKRFNRVEGISVVFLVVEACCCFFSGIFECLLIDPAVAAVAAYVLSLILFSKDKDVVYDISVILGCVFLVLLKDVGMLFACVNGFLYFVDAMKREMKLLNRIYYLMPMLVSFIIKLSWKYELKRNRVSAHFQAKINLREYLEMLFKKNGTDYKQDVVNSSIEAFYEKRFHMSFLNLSYFDILLCLTLVAFVFLIIKKIGNKETSILKPIVLIATASIVTILYSVFIGAMYAYRFTEYEAKILSSYDRYMSICFLALSIIVILTVCYSLRSNKRRTVLIILFSVSVLLLTDNPAIMDYVSRNNIKDGVEFKERYNSILQEIDTYCDQDDVLCILSRGDRGLDKLVMKYYCRPIKVDSSLGYSLGGPSFEEDIWYTEITPVDFMNTLIKNGVTYVAIVDAGDDFADNYGELFEDINAIEDDSLFVVDGLNKTLIRAE